MTLRLAAAVLIAAFPGPLLAQADAQVVELAEALGLDRLVEVMHAEGLDYGAELEAEMFPGRGGQAWAATVAQIYDSQGMYDRVTGEMTAELAGTDIAPILEFFTSDLGRSIVSFEVSARQALLDEDVEEAAKDRYREMRADGEERLAPLDRFAEANQLVDYNVMGAMNSSYAFYMGLIDGGALPKTMTEGEVLREVWEQEPAIREDTETWIYAFLALAYQPLSEDDVEAYIAFSETGPGQALNAALFAAFDAMYIDISRALGVAAARLSVGEDI